MYMTIWTIQDEMDEKTTTTQLTYYHFGKTPKFPSWYMEENHTYNIEMDFNFKLICKIGIFFKCLTHCYIIKNKA